MVGLISLYHTPSNMVTAESDFGHLMGTKKALDLEFSEGSSGGSTSSQTQITAVYQPSSQEQVHFICVENWIASLGLNVGSWLGKCKVCQ